jgi:hypothetical protein
LEKVNPDVLDLFEEVATNMIEKLGAKNAL